MTKLETKVSNYIYTPKESDVCKMKEILGGDPIWVFSISDNGEIIEGKGWIEYKEMISGHNGLDYGSDVMLFSPKNTNRIEERWWSPCKKDAIDKQKWLLDKQIKELESEIKTLKARYEL